MTALLLSRRGFRMGAMVLSLALLAVTSGGGMASPAADLTATDGAVHPTVTASSLPDPTSTGWVLECVDCPKIIELMTDRSLRLDDAGRPHIAYGGDHLYYAWHDGTAWKYETVDASPGIGQYASLALDSHGRPHISFYDSSNGNLKYTRWDGAAWAIETVDSGGDVGLYTSLALDSQNRPHIRATTTKPIVT